MQVFLMLWLTLVIGLVCLAFLLYQIHPLLGLICILFAFRACK
jgi:hypothetical protein